MLTKYYLIYFYHDTYFLEFNDLTLLYCHLKELISIYKNDSDFSYKIIYGLELKN